MSDKKKSPLKGKIKGNVSPVSDPVELPSMKTTNTPPIPKKEPNKKTGIKKRIPKEWKNHLIKMNPTTKERLKKAVQYAQFIGDENNNLQNFFIDNALNEYLTKYEKKYNK